MIRAAVAIVRPVACVIAYAVLAIEEWRHPLNAPDNPYPGGGD